MTNSVSVSPALREQYRLAADEFTRAYDALGDRCLTDCYAAQNLVRSFWTQPANAALVCSEFAQYQYWRSACLVNKAAANQDRMLLWKAHFHVALAVYLEYMSAMGADAFWEAFEYGQSSLILKPMYECLHRLMSNKGLVDFLAHKFPKATKGRPVENNDRLAENGKQGDREEDASNSSSVWNKNNTFVPIDGDQSN